MGDNELTLGLHANIRRMRAERAIDMAIGSSAAENGETMDRLMLQLGVSPSVIDRRQVDRARDEQRQALRSVTHGS